MTDPRRQVRLWLAVVLIVAALIAVDVICYRAIAAGGLRPGGIGNSLSTIVIVLVALHVAVVGYFLANRHVNPEPRTFDEKLRYWRNVAILVIIIAGVAIVLLRRMAS